MDLFTYLMAKKGQNTQRDLFSYLLGKEAGGSGTYVNFTGTSLNISNTLKARIKNITLKGATSQHTTTGEQLFNINDLKSIPGGVTIGDDGYVTLNIVNNNSSTLYVDLPTHNLNLQNSTNYLLITEIENISRCDLLSCTQWGQITTSVQKNATGTSINTITTKATFSNDIGINTSVAIYANTTGTVKFRLSVYPYSTMAVDDFIYEEYTGGQPSPSPSYPQKVKVVTGEQNVNVKGKNLYNTEEFHNTFTSTTFTNFGENLAIKNNYGSISRLLDLETNYFKLTTTNNYDITQSWKFINLKPNTTYNISCDMNTNISSSTIWVFGNNRQTTDKKITTSFTTNENGEYTYNLMFYSPSRNSSQYIILSSIQLEKGSTATPYTPYYSKDYPLSLGTLELAEIRENYQDYIYGSPNNWYKHEVIKKVVITNDAIIEKIPNIRYNIKDDIGYYFSGDTSQPGAISNCYIPRYANTTGSILSSSTYNAISVYDDRFASVSDFKTWAIPNLIIYRILSTARDISITDTTLIEQLNNLYNATSQDGTTIITCSSASDSNEIIVFSGDIKVASVGLGNSLNTSLLSSNIQEEPNLDDVNETEDIEQNEEPIEEEVS